MKRSIILSCFLLLAANSFSQEAIDILKKSREKCQAITNGYYEMIRHYKNMSGPDTTVHLTKCYFGKSKANAPFPFLFQLQYYKDGLHTTSSLFTGTELINFSLKDSTGVVMGMDKWKKEIELRSDDYNFFSPFTSKNCSPLPKKSNYAEPTFRLKWLGEEKVNGMACFHIETRELPQMENGFPAEVLDLVSHFWINTVDMVPMQISQTFTMVMGKDTMVQFEMFTLGKYELNIPFDQEKVSSSVVPSYINLIAYTPYTRPEPLPLDTIAPTWSFSSLSDETVSLDGLKGKLVLLDFFYKSCFPCMEALPVLQALHEKYKDSGLVVIGLDPYDDKADNLPEFLAKRNVDYTVLYASKEIAKTYRVSGYPTMYLVDQDGRIIFVQEGYGDGVEAELEEIILKHIGK